MPLKRNGPAQLAVLFLLVIASTAFWLGRGIGLPEALIGTGLKIYDTINGFVGGNLAPLEEFGPLRSGVSAVITLVLYYLVSAGIVTVLNALWNEPEKEVAPPEIKQKPAQPVDGIAEKIGSHSDTTELAKSKRT